MSSFQRQMARMVTGRLLVPSQVGEAFQLELTDMEIAALLEARGLPYRVTPTGTVQVVRPGNHEERRHRA